MKLKLGIICGVLIWIITSVLSEIFNPIFNSNLPGVNIIVPIIIIIVTGFFGIIYIRNILFIIIDVILDAVIFILPGTPNIIGGSYPLHVISTIIITLSITTLLGYLAQMNIDLK